MQLLKRSSLQQKSNSVLINNTLSHRKIKKFLPFTVWHIDLQPIQLWFLYRGIPSLKTRNQIHLLVLLHKGTIIISALDKHKSDTVLYRGCRKDLYCLTVLHLTSNPKLNMVSFPELKCVVNIKTSHLNHSDLSLYLVTPAHKRKVTQVFIK